MEYLYGIVLGLYLNFFFFHKKKIFDYLFCIFFILSFLIFLSVDVITDNGFNKAFWYHITDNLISGSYAPYISLFIFKFLIILTLVFFGFFIGRKIIKKKFKLPNHFYKYIFALLLLINPLLISVFNNFLYEKHVSKINIDFKNYFHRVEDLGNKFIDRDLIIIVAESLERTYYVNSRLKNLNLKLLKRNNLIDFSNILEVEDYTSWTIAGLVSINCSLPFINNNFFQSENCLSDFLKKRNYDLTAIQGSDLNFAGNGNFYRSHNIDKVFGSNEIIKKYPGYKKSNWGIHDDLLFEFSKDKLLMMENEAQNFAIWINTLDSHPPNGLLSANCKNLTKNIKNKLLKTVYCTDYYINDFIDFSEKNDRDNNNLYVVVSDHLLNPSHVEKKFFNEYDKRKNLFLIIDPKSDEKKITIEKQGSQIDILPTLIDYLNGPDKINLGVSLFTKSEKSLSEKFKDLKSAFFSFENDLKNLENSMDLKKLSISLENKYAYFNNKYKLPIPVINYKNSLQIVETDPYGKSKETILDKINEMFIKKNNDLNFESIVKCNSLETYEIEFKIKCNFAYFEVKEIIPKKNVMLNVIPYTEYENRFLKISDKSYQKEMSKKNFLLATSTSINKESKLKKKIKQIKLKYTNLLKSNFPEIYSFIFKKYLNYKIKNDKKKFEKKFGENNKIKIEINNLLAHGGGAIDQLKKTNSLQALNENYNKGIRYFELDLNLTSDQKIVATHDWESWKKNTGYTGKIPPSHEKFMKKKIYSIYDPLDEDKILKWFQDRPDTILVTDKLNDAIYISQKLDNIKDRILIELFTQDEVNRALEKKINNILISQRILWQNGYSIEYLNRLSSETIKPHGFSVDKNLVYKYPDFFLRAKNLNFKTYVYNLNDLSLNEGETDVLCNQFNFIEGIYTDYLDLSKLNNNIIECNN